MPRHLDRRAHFRMQVCPRPGMAASYPAGSRTLTRGLGTPPELVFCTRGANGNHPVAETVGVHAFPRRMRADLFEGHAFSEKAFLGKPRVVFGHV
jgi:hypothetical protein